MNNGLKKFEELVKTDTAFQEKLKTAMENYNGEQTEQAVFEEVLVPIAKEYGITASFEEFQTYIRDLEVNRTSELSLDEMAQVAGGAKTDGVGGGVCYKVGIGMVCIIDDKCDVRCYGIGIGQGAGGCMGEGDSTSINF